MLQKIKNTVLKQLKQGTTSKKVAQSILVGVLVGLFPVLGFTTILCVTIGHALKQNHVIIQSVHHLVFPLQMLIIPLYIKLITTYTGQTIPARPDHLVRYVLDHPILFLREFGLIAVYAAILWMVVSVPLYLLLQNPLCKIITKFRREKNNQRLTTKT